MHTLSYPLLRWQECPPPRMLEKFYFDRDSICRSNSIGINEAGENSQKVQPPLSHCPFYFLMMEHGLHLIMNHSTPTPVLGNYSSDYQRCGKSLVSQRGILVIEILVKEIMVNPC